MSAVDARILPQDGHAGTTEPDQRFVRSGIRVALSSKAGLVRTDRHACGVDGTQAGQARLLAEFGRQFQRQRCFETATEGEMQIHALRELFALHAEQGDAGGIKVQLLLLAGA